MPLGRFAAVVGRCRIVGSSDARYLARSRKSRRFLAQRAAARVVSIDAIVGLSRIRVSVNPCTQEQPYDLSIVTTCRPRIGSRGGHTSGRAARAARTGTTNIGRPPRWFLGRLWRHGRKPRIESRIRRHRSRGRRRARPLHHALEAARWDSRRPARCSSPSRAVRKRRRTPQSAAASIAPVSTSAIRRCSARWDRSSVQAR